MCNGCCAPGGCCSSTGCCLPSDGGCNGGGCKVDWKFVTSFHALCLFFLLPIELGIFGVIANSDLQVTATLGEVMMWISFVAFISILLLYVPSFFGRQPLSDKILAILYFFMMSLMITATVLWGRFDVFPVTDMSRHQLFIFILGILASVIYYALFITFALESCKTKDKLDMIELTRAENGNGKIVEQPPRAAERNTHFQIVEDEPDNEAAI